MIKILLISFLVLGSLYGKAQESKTSDFSNKNVSCEYKIKSPGIFSKIDSGQILIIKIQNTDTINNNVSFKVVEYLTGVAQSKTDDLSNCLKPNKKKKIKVLLENFKSAENYDWAFSDVTVLQTESCPKK